MKSPEFRSGFQLVGEPRVVAENPWFTLNNQPMNFINPETGKIMKSVEDGGQMNYIDANPGVTIVGETHDGRTVLIPQERHATNIVEARAGRPLARHYEFPAGGIDKPQIEIDEADIYAAAEREFGEEAALQAEEYIILGSLHRGLMSHPGMMTNNNFTVLARGLRSKEGGTEHELTEQIGNKEIFSWRDAKTMYRNPEGLWTPEGFKVISSMATVASMALALDWLEEHNEHRPTYFSSAKIPGVTSSKR